VIGLSPHQHSIMRAFIVCLAIAAVSGDAKPYTIAQVAAGLPVRNALADGRPHNVGVITNAVEAGVKTVGAIPVAAGVYSGYPYGAVPHVAGVYSAYPYGVHAYGKREAEPYTLEQVAHGKTNGGVVTAIDYGHGTGLQPATAVTHTVPAVYAAHVPAVHAAVPAVHAAVPAVHAAVPAGVYSGYPYGAVPHVAGVYSAYPYGVHAYGKREAEPYTLEQVTHGKTAGGVITAIDYGHGTGLQPATAVTHNTVAVPAVYAGHVPAVYAGHIPAVYAAHVPTVQAAAYASHAYSAYSAVPTYYYG